ncbi:MAG: hypothetical protein EOO78_37545, partial [Oxalobacteraceae bacterium]
EVRAPAQQSGEQLLVATTANRVYALDAASGQVLWSQGRPPPHRLTVDGHAQATPRDGRVFVSFADGFAMALRQHDGAILWERPLSLRGGPFVDADADPVAGQTHAFFASYSDGVFALQVADGQVGWNHSVYGATSLIARGEALLVGLADGTVLALRQSDGAPLWHSRVGHGPVSRLLVDGPYVLLTGGDGMLVVLDLLTGRPVQAAPLGARTVGDPQAQGGMVGVVTVDGALLLWSREL